MTFTRRKLLAGILAVLLAVWLLDTLARSRGPATAKGATSGNLLRVSSSAGPAASPVLNTAATVPPAGPGDSAGGPAGELTTQPTTQASIATELEQLDRDLFVPSRRLVTALDQASENSAESAATSAPAPVEVPFDQRHVLEGVILGPRPLAVVDGRVLAIGAVLEEYTLERIERDAAIFRDADTEMILKVAPPAKRTAP